MSTGRFECPACGKTYPWVEKFANKKILCHCGTKLRVPGFDGGDVTVIAASPTAPPRVTEPTIVPVFDAANPPPPPPPPKPTSVPSTAELKKAAEEPVDVMAAMTPSPRAVPVITPGRRAPAEPEPPPEKDEDYELNLESVEPAARKAVAAPAAARPLAMPLTSFDNAALPEPKPGEGIECPSCGKLYHQSARLCVPCGIDIRSGRAFITSNPGDLERIYENADRVFRWVSWPLVMGVYPFATEAVGGRPRYAVWTITALTVIVSIWFYFLMVTDSPVLREAKFLMLWSGRAPDKSYEVVQGYKQHPRNMGDERAFRQKLEEVRERLAKEEAEKARAAAKTGKKPGSPPANPAAPRGPGALPDPSSRPAPPAGAHHTGDDDELEDEMLDDSDSKLASDPAVMAAYNELTPPQKVFGEFHVTQLITHALLHGGFWHLAGNLLFLLVFGLAVNGLIGNVGTAVIYPLLAVFAGIAHHITQSDETVSPMLGASGAIMGMAGMYFVFFPVHRVHVAAFIRPWPFVILMAFSFFLIRYIVYALKIYMKLFACRGFWILLFYIGFDVYSTWQGAKDGTAHWAHLGGFLAGMGIAFVLLVTKAVNCRGADLLTVIFGRYAWPLVGKPSQWAERGDDEGWLQRLHFSAALPARPTRVKAQA